MPDPHLDTLRQGLSDHYRRVEELRRGGGEMTATIAPANAVDRSANKLRPRTLDTIVGQRGARDLMRAAIDAAERRHEPLDHALLVGPSGTGKSTFSHVVAEEMGVDVYDLEAPISYDTLLTLRETMRDRDILKVEEIHQQAIMERRGRSTATQPEVLYAVMEDRVLLTERGPLPFPAITVIGTTTDEGMLPDAFVNRFPLRPRLVAYTDEDLWLIAVRNAQALGLTVTRGGATVLAMACGGVPRHINNLVKNVAIFSTILDVRAAKNVLDVNGITRDGLLPDQQAMLRFLYLRAAQTVRGDVRYQASVSTIATAIGKSRDSKAIAMRVEPLLIERGLVQVTHGGRRLTDAGINRARELT